MAREADHLVQAVMQRAEAVAAELPRLYAALSAVNLATGAGAFELHRLSVAVEGIVGNGKLLAGQKSVPVPDEVSETIRALDGKGAAFLARCAVNVAMP